VYLSWDVATLYLSLQDFFKTRPSSAPPNPTILQDIGLPRPAFQNKDTFADYISLERLPDLDADYLFYSAFGEPAKTDPMAALASLLWGRLKAVQSKRAIAVDDDTWFLAIGIQGAHRVLDDIERFLR
jgi:iron complex transport system substrate-binding protein